jgi:hypothetical protein
VKVNVEYSTILALLSGEVSLRFSAEEKSSVKKRVSPPIGRSGLILLFVDAVLELSFSGPSLCSLGTGIKRFSTKAFQSSHLSSSMILIVPLSELISKRDVDSQVILTECL